MHAVISAAQRKAVAQWLRVRIQRNGDGGAVLFMRTHQLRQVKIAGCVAAYDEKIFIFVKIGAVFNAARRAESLMFHPVLHVNAQPFAAAEVVFYILGSVFQACTDIRQAVLFEQQHDMLNDRSAA